MVTRLGLGLATCSRALTGLAGWSPRVPAAVRPHPTAAPVASFAALKGPDEQEGLRVAHQATGEDFQAN